MQCGELFRWGVLAMIAAAMPGGAALATEPGGLGPVPEARQVDTNAGAEAGRGDHVAGPSLPLIETAPPSIPLWDGSAMRVPLPLSRPPGAQVESRSGSELKVAAAQEGGGSPPVRNARFTRKDLCDLIAAAAATHQLPNEFFTRLIWQESSFRIDALSPVGAQGIAQFMPYTARERGLADPFDPRQALPKSAEFLRDLRGRFGNWGLAAAAYNAGPERVQDWISGRAGLPLETQRYVLAITGLAAANWAKADAILPKSGVSRQAGGRSDCLTVVALLPEQSVRARVPQPPRPPANPWGVQLAGGTSEAEATSAFKNLQRKYASVLKGRSPLVIKTRVGGRQPRYWYQVRVAERTRASASALCSRLKAAGASCVIMRN